ncbi:MAG: hypothetical protein ABI830_07070 [Pseudolabrys sp.]
MTRSGKRVVALAGVGLLLAACGTSSNFLSGSSLDVFRTSSKATTGTNDNTAEADTDVSCPGVDVRTGASTLMIGSKPGNEEPSALDLRYQGTITRTARECRVNAGVMNMKVGIEGRVITGPAGGPGPVEVPIRIAVVQEGVSPKTIVSKLVRIPVNVTGDRASFTHIDPEITFPMPVPLANIDAYVVYVGFDAIAARPETKKPAPKKKPAARPKAPPKQS